MGCLMLNVREIMYLPWIIDWYIIKKAMFYLWDLIVNDTGLSTMREN